MSKLLDMFVLRSKVDDRPLGIAFSRDGLKWINDPKGHLVFFKNAKLKQENGKVVFEGDTSFNPKAYIEIYTPRRHRNRSIQVIESKTQLKVKQFESGIQ